MHEQQLPLEYAVPAPVARAKRPFWVNVTYLILGAAAMGIAVLLLFERIDLFSLFGHSEIYAAFVGCPAMVVLGLIFMTKGLAILENNQKES